MCFIDMQDLKSKLSGEDKIHSITHASNVLGVVNPIKGACSGFFREVGADDGCDGAQSTLIWLYYCEVAHEKR